MITWMLILSTIIPTYSMDRFQRKDIRKFNRQEKRIERKEDRQIKRGSTDHRRSALNRHEP